MKTLKRWVIALVLTVGLTSPAIAQAAITKYNAGTPRKDFVDVASHQGQVSVNDYKIMKGEGVKGVVVKLTEGTGYVNPYAQNQINNAKTAGLQVSVYHFSRYTSQNGAQNEARFFANTARKMGLSNETVLVNDAEAGEFRYNNAVANNTNNKAFDDTVRAVGFKNTDIYTMGSWVNTTFNIKNSDGWIANYPSYPSAKNLLYSDRNAWQWASDYNFMGVQNTGTKNFDVSQDYTGKYTRGVKDTEKPVPTNPTKPVPNNQYIVRAGDSLWLIANNHSTTVTNLKVLNNLNSDIIYVGQVLKVSGKVTQPNPPINNVTSVYTVRSGDTLSGIGSKLGINWKTIANTNSINYPYTIYVGQQLKTAGGNQSKVYVVRSGDNLSVIAERVGSSWQALASKNGIGYPYTIQPNQQLKY